MSRLIVTVEERTDEWGWVLRVLHDGKQIREEYDAGEPEEEMPNPKSSDSLAQDEIERLRKKLLALVYEPPPTKGVVYAEIDALAALARRLLKERDAAMAVIRGEAAPNKYHDRGLLAVGQELIKREKERDEARRLHDSCCMNAGTCTPPWGKR